MTPDQSLAGKIVLVTGASRGIGYQAALEAGRRGAHVIAVARTIGGLEELDDEIQAAGGGTTLVPMDLRDGDAIDRLGRAIFERWGHLDALIGNAGMLNTISPLAHVEPKEFDQVFAVNVTANYRLIRSMDLLLRQSAAGRALFLTSGVVNRAQAYWAPYTASKAALEALIKVYAQEMKSTPVKVNLLNPGPLRTALRALGWPGEDKDALKRPVVVAADIVRMVSPDFTESGTLYDFPTGTSRSLTEK